MSPVPNPDLKAAYAHCRKLAFGHYENFPVASWLLPQPQRDAIAAIYAFARQADDFADEPAYARDRVRLLKDWMGRLQRPAKGGDLIFQALHDSIRQYHLPKPLLADLVRAFLQDCSKARYRNFEEVLAYCKLSAVPVGRLVLRVFERDSPEACAQSDGICTALQLANHWQDLASDVQSRDRIYLPQDELRRYKVSEGSLRAGTFTPGMAELMRLQVDRAETLFVVGEPLPAALGGRLGVEIGLTLLGGRRILHKIRQQSYNTLGTRPKVGVWDAPGLLVKAFAGRVA
jgi:squalene synthase HpnC